MIPARTKKGVLCYRERSLAPGSCTMVMQTERWTDIVWSLSQTLPEHNTKRLKSHHTKRTESYRRKEGEKKISSVTGEGWRETPEEFLSLRTPILGPEGDWSRGKRIS